MKLDLSTKLLNGQRNLKQANGNRFALAWNLRPQDQNLYFEPGSTYTTFSTQSGSTYEWGLNHRAATEHDVLMLTMGPQQENLSVNNAGQDQLMQLRTWLKAQGKMPQGNTVEQYTVYSDSFAAMAALLVAALTDPTFRLNRATAALRFRCGS